MLIILERERREGLVTGEFLSRYNQQYHGSRATTAPVTLITSEEDEQRTFVTLTQ